MRKIVLLLIAAIGLSIAGKAQTSAGGYQFCRSSGTYTAITGGTGAHTGAWTDAITANVSIGFTFQFRGLNFTKVAISSNGFIMFGTGTASATNYTPISTLGTNDSGVVSATGCNIQASSSNDTVSYLTTGSAGSRVFTVQYKNTRFQGSAATESWNFQIKLYETSNIIQVVYGTNTTPTAARTCQVGIRGLATTDVNNVIATVASWATNTQGTANTSTCTRSTTVQPASGLTFTWCPVSQLPNVTASASGCTSTYTATASGASTYRWAPATSLSATTGSSVSVTASALAYTVTGVASNGCTNVATIAQNLHAVLAAATTNSVCPGTTTTLVAGPTTTTTYLVSSISYTSYSTASGFTTTAAGDDATYSATIPFTFSYFGTNYTTVNVGTNGNIHFGTAVVGGYPGITLPNTGKPTGMISAFLHDMNTGSGTLKYGTVGTAPNRVFVVDYNNYGDFSGTGVNTGQICLYEGTNVVEIHVNTTTSTIASVKVCGIQNIARDNGYNAPGRGGTFYSVTTPEGWRFTPVSSTPTYAWTPSSTLSSSTSSTPVATPTATTTYSVDITANGCTYTGTKVITAFATPTVTVSPTNACYGINMVASGATTYSWSPATGLSATTGATVNPTPGSATTYTVTGTNANGCTGTATKTVNLRPTIGVTPTTANFCTVPGTPIALTGSTSGGSTTYSWNPATTLDASTGVTVNSTPTATTTTYTVTGTEVSTGCSGTATAVITKLITPAGIVPYVASDTVVCFPGYALMTDAGTGGTWSSSNTAVFTMDAGGGLYPVSTGTAYVRYISPCGSDSLSVRVAGGGFTLSVTPTSSTYCSSGSPVTITASSSDAGTDTWLWTDIGGGAPVGLSSTSTPTTTASPSVTAIYAIFGTNSTTGCHAVITDTVINNTPAAITGTNTVCVSSTRTYSCSTSGGTWSSSATGIATVNTASGVITGVTAGSATITYTVTATGCYVTRGITVNALPTLSFTPSSAYACGGIGVSVVASGASTYSWSPATGLSATTGATVTANPGSTTTYTITGTAASGCVNTGTKTVTFGATFMAGFITPAADTVCPGGTDVLTGQVAASTTSYTLSSITYTAFSTAGFSAGPTGDDINSSVTIPFTFNFFGVDYTTLNLNTNGGVHFGTAVTTGYPAAALPNATQPTGFIGLFFHDMNTGGGTISYGTIGTTPYRKFVMSYNAYGDFTGTGTNTGQIVLYESSNVIECHVNTTSSSNAYTKVCGIQNIARSIGFNATGRNGVVYNITTPEAWRFTPSFPSATYAWAGSTTSASTGTPVTATVSGTQTYTVTVTDPGSGCNGSFSRTIYNYTNPTVSISPSTVCVGNTMTASGATTYAWSPATGLSATTGASVVTSSYAIPTYTVTGTDANGCTGTATKNISYPTISVTPSTTIFCSAGAPAGLTASGTSVSYSWSPSAGLSATTGASVNASPTVTTVYTVTGTDASGCTGPASTTVTYNVTPSSIMGAGGSSTICLPGTLALTTDGTGGTWSSSATSIATVDGAGIVTGVDTGTVTITYNNATCGFVTYGITVLPGGFAVSTTPSSGTYCSTGSALSITASGGTLYSWSPATGLSASTGATVSASPTVTTTYTVTGVTGGCSNTATIVVTNNTPAAIAGGTTSICTGLTTTWTCATGGGTWSSSATGTATVNPSTGVVYGVAAGSATITYDISGCYVTRAITVNATPTLSFTPTSAYACGGIAVSVTASGASTYSWTPGSGLSATTGATVSANPTVTTTYTITGTSAAGCVGTATKVVNYGTTSMLAYASSSPSTVCPGSTTTLTGQPAASTTYVQSAITYAAASTSGFTAGPAGDDVNSGAITLPFTFNYFGVNYSSIYICTNGFVSFTTASTNLTNYALPSATAATAMGPLVAMGMHDMNTGSGTISYGTIGTTPNRTFVISWNAYGDFSCGGTNTGQIKLYESSNVVDIAVSSLSGTCTNTVGIQNAAGTTAYTATSPTINGTAGAIATLPKAWRYTPSFPSATYAWVPTTGVTSTASATTTATVSATTAYTVTVTDPASGCNASFATTVTAYPIPTVTVSPSVVCSGSAMTASGANTYSWSPATTISATSGATVTASPTVTTTYSVSGVDTNGCTGTATKSVQLPTLSVSPTSALYCSSGSPVGITASGSGSSYSWSPGSGLDATTGASVNASPTTNTTFTVTSTDGSGCTNTATSAITYNVTTSGISWPSGTLCLPGTMLLTESGTGGSWTSSDTTLGTVNSSGLVTGVAAGSYTITYDNPACGGSATYGLTNAPGGFTISVSPSSGTYCSTGSALSATASGATTYSWLPTAGLDVTTGASVNASPTVTTVYTVTGTSGACSNSATLTVTNNTPAPITGGVTTICSSITGALSTVSTTWTCATGGGTWSSSSSGVATVSTGGVITGVSGGTATITYNVSGCYVTRNITVNASPAMTFTPTTAAVCSGTGVVITASGASTYSWTPAAGLSSTVSATPTCTATTTTTYTVTGTSAAGCVVSTTKVVNIGSAVFAYASSSPTKVCTGGVTTLTGAVASGTTYAQSAITYAAASTTGFTAGPAGDDVNSGAITLPFTFNFFGTNYSSIRICTNGWVSFTSTSTNLTNYALPSATAATTMGPLIAMGMHDMNTGSGNINYGTIGTTPNRTFVISWNAYGDFSCGGTNTGQIKLYESSNIIDIAVSSLSGTCTNTVGIQNAAGSTAYTATSPTINGTTGAIGSLPAAWRYTPTSATATYAWTPSSGVTSSAAATTTATVTSTTTYTLTVTEPATGCAGTYTTVDTAVAQPTVTLTSTQANFCSGGLDSLIAVPSGGLGTITSYTWSGPGIATTTGATATATFNPTTAATTSGAYTVSVAYSGSLGCGPAVGTSSSVTLNSDPIVTVSASLSTTCPSDTLFLTESLTSGGSGTPTYSWTGPGISTTTGTSSTSPALFPSSPSSGAYSVAVTYSGVGCDVANASTSTVTNYSNPGISIGANPSICQPTSAINLTYSSPTGSPTNYSIVWSGGALAAGFSNVTGASLPASPVAISIPTTTVTGVFTGTMTVTNGGSCPSSTYPFTITIYAYPTASIGSVTPPCSGYATNVVFNGTSGATISYNIDGGSATTATLTGGTFSLSTGAITAPRTYYLTSCYNPACSTPLTDSVVVNPIAMTWLGTTSNWNTASNWACGFVPGASDDAIIPATANNPAIAASASGTTRNISIASGVTVNIGSSGTLNVKGNMASSGTVNGTGKTVFNGSSAQTITGLFNINDVQVDNSAGVSITSGGRMTLHGVLTMTSGTLATGDSLVLDADSTSTSRVDSVSPSASITGSTKVNVWIPGGRRAYRFWSHPFSNYIGLTQANNYIDVTGSGGPTNGFTYTASNAPSAFRYNTLVGNSSLTSDPGWKPFASAYTTVDSNRIHQYQGIRLFFRGTKGQGLDYVPYTPNSVKVSQWGTLNVGTQTVTLAKGTANPYQEYNMVGNPYAAPVDIGTVVYNALVAGSVVGSAYFVWNPNLGTAGQYVPRTISTVSATPYYLAACNAFQVRAAYNGSTLSFTEGRKGVAPSSGLFKASPDYTTIELLDANYHPYDMALIRFNESATDANDYYLDAVKPEGGSDVNFYALASGGEMLAVDARPFDAAKTIPLGINSKIQRDFILKAEGVTLPEGRQLYLHDKLLKQYVQLNSGTEYRFTINDEAATQGNDRFELAMKPAGEVASKDALNVSVVPNPTSDDVNISFSGSKAENVSVRITDLSGVTIFSKNVGNRPTGTVNVQMSNFASGVYMIELVSGDQKVVQRLVKE